MLLASLIFQSQVTTLKGNFYAGSVMWKGKAFSLVSCLHLLNSQKSFASLQIICISTQANNMLKTRITSKIS